MPYFATFKTLSQKNDTKETFYDVLLRRVYNALYGAQCALWYNPTFKRKTARRGVVFRVIRDFIVDLRLQFFVFPEN